MRDPASAGGWNGWGNGVANTRFQSRQRRAHRRRPPEAETEVGVRLSGRHLGARAADVAGGRLFVASENGEVHALDPKTGCTHWTFKAQAGVRTALSVGPVQERASARGYAVYFGDSRANVYAVDAQHRPADLGPQG